MEKGFPQPKEVRFFLITWVREGNLWGHCGQMGVHLWIPSMNLGHISPERKCWLRGNGLSKLTCSRVFFEPPIPLIKAVNLVISEERRELWKSPKKGVNFETKFPRRSCLDWSLIYSLLSSLSSWAMFLTASASSMATLDGAGTSPSERVPDSAMHAFSAIEGQNLFYSALGSRRKRKWLYHRIRRLYWYDVMSCPYEHLLIYFFFCRIRSARRAAVHVVDPCWILSARWRVRWNEVSAIFSENCPEIRPEISSAFLTGRKVFPQNLTQFFLGQKGCRTKSPWIFRIFAPNFAPKLSRVFRALFPWKRRPGKIHRHFSMPNAQTKWKNKFKKVFWRAGTTFTPKFHNTFLQAWPP